jgi:hypothetical protein
MTKKPGVPRVPNRLRRGADSPASGLSGAVSGEIRDIAPSLHAHVDVIGRSRTMRG